MSTISLPVPSVAETSSVDLHVLCRGLPRKDVLSASDPYCAMFERKKNKWIPLGKTETIWNTHNPEFVHAFRLPYHFESVQELKFEIWDKDDHKNSDDFLGSLEVTMSKIMTSKGQVLLTDLLGTSGRKAGKIAIRAEEVSNCKKRLEVELSGVSLPIKDKVACIACGSSDPFLTIHRQSEDGTWVSVHQTEVIKKNLNPRWKPIRISCAKLCCGDLDRPIQLRCFDYDFDGGHDAIGRTQCSVNKLSSSLGQMLPLNNPQKPGNCGSLQILSVQLTEPPSFLDWIKGGMPVKLCCAVDFTASNAEPGLHRADYTGESVYQKALRQVVTILSDYSQSGNVAMYGFGGKLASTGQVSHCFPLMSPQPAEVSGIDGVMNSYAIALSNVQLAGPTLFAPFLRTVTTVVEQDQAAAKSSGSQESYHVVLILTDGVIHDMDDTKSVIVEKLARMPVSIIIVGVGDADFSLMEELDGDNERLSVNGKEAARDCVQFVKYNDFTTIERLSSEVLAEVPDQVCDFKALAKTAAPTPLRSVTIPLEHVPSMTETSPQPPTTVRTSTSSAVGYTPADATQAPTKRGSKQDLARAQSSISGPGPGPMIIMMQQPAQPESS